MLQAVQSIRSDLARSNLDCLTRFVTGGIRGDQDELCSETPLT